MSLSYRGAGSLPAVIALSLLISPLNAQSEKKSTPNLWKDPVFRKQLMGTFGLDPVLEPSVTEDEQIYYDKLIPMMSGNKEEVDKAVAYFQEILKDPNASARFDFLLGNVYFAQNRKSEAAQHFKDALRKFPTYRKAHQNLGIIYVQEGAFAPAIKHLTETMRLGLSDGNIYGLLGTAYIMSERFISAESAFRNATLMAPDRKEWKMGLARSLFAQERYADVISLMNALIEESPDDHLLWLLQASAYVGNKDFLSAATNYELVDEMGKLPASELETLAKIYVNEGLLNLAADTYLRAYQNNIAGGIEGPLVAAEILMARNGLDAANRLLARVRDAAGEEMKNADRNRLFKLEAKICFDQNNPGEATDLLQRVIDNDPLDGEARLLLGDYYMQTASYDKAMALLDEAMQSEKTEADAKVLKARVLVQLKQYEEALPLLRSAQELKPRDNVASFLDDLEKHVKNRR